MSLGDTLGDIFKEAAITAIQVTGDVVRARNIPPAVVLSPAQISPGLGPVTAPPGFGAETGAGQFGGPGAAPLAIGPGGGGGRMANGGGLTSELRALEALSGGGGALTRRAPGGIGLGVSSGMFHVTPTGRVMPNRLSLVADQATGALMFAANAGIPKTFSKITFRKPRPRHHHHRPR